LPDCARPNILLITTDQQRYDTLGVNGSQVCRTPNLDALASRGVRFDRAYIQNPVCIPSRACLMTGRYTHQHGVRYMETVIDRTPGLPDWELTIQRRLQLAGYHTAAFGKIHMMPDRDFDTMQTCGGKGARWTQSSGMDIGPGPLGPQYASWLESRRPGAYEEIYAQRRRPEYTKYHTAVVNVLPLEEYVDYWIAGNTIDFLKRDHDRPFFAWCGFCGPHGPMDPPKPYDELYPFGEVPLPETLTRPGDPNKPLWSRGSTQSFASPQGEEKARRLIAYYWGLCTLLDDQVGRILATLHEQGLADNTVILYTTDHGEMLCDWGRLGKSNFYEQVIRAPFLAWAPGCAGGTVVDSLIETADLAATVLDYAGVPLPAQMSAQSLRPLLDGKPGGRDSVLCEYTTNDQSRSGKCLRTRDAKYVFWGMDQPEEFYNLVTDPGEKRNAVGDPAYAEQVTEHRRLLLDRVMRSERPWLRAG
jgi:arylsulfatase A-like enzyme